MIRRIYKVVFKKIRWDISLEIDDERDYDDIDLPTELDYYTAATSTDDAESEAVEAMSDEFSFCPNSYDVEFYSVSDAEAEARGFILPQHKNPRRNPARNIR